MWRLKESQRNKEKEMDSLCHRPEPSESLWAGSAALVGSLDKNQSLECLTLSTLDFQPMESSVTADTDKVDNSIIESATREHVFTDFVDSRWRQADTEAKTFEMERIKQLQGKGTRC